MMEAQTFSPLASRLINPLPDDHNDHEIPVRPAKRTALERCSMVFKSLFGRQGSPKGDSSQSKRAVRWPGFRNANANKQVQARGGPALEQRSLPGAKVIGYSGRIRRTNTQSGARLEELTGPSSFGLSQTPSSSHTGAKSRTKLPEPLTAPLRTGWQASQPAALPDSFRSLKDLAAQAPKPRSRGGGGAWDRGQTAAGRGKSTGIGERPTTSPGPLARTLSGRSDISNASACTDHSAATTSNIPRARPPRQAAGQKDTRLWPVECTRGGLYLATSPGSMTPVKKQPAPNNLTARAPPPVPSRMIHMAAQVPSPAPNHMAHMAAKAHSPASNHMANMAVQAPFPATCDPKGSPAHVPRPSLPNRQPGPPGRLATPSTADSRRPSSVAPSGESLLHRDVNGVVSGNIDDRGDSLLGKNMDSVMSSGGPKSTASSRLGRLQVQVQVSNPGPVTANLPAASMALGHGMLAALTGGRGEDISRDDDESWLMMRATLALNEFQMAQYLDRRAPSHSPSAPLTPGNPKGRLKSWQGPSRADNGENEDPGQPLSVELPGSPVLRKSWSPAGSPQPAKSPSRLLTHLAESSLCSSPRAEMRRSYLRHMGSKMRSSLEHGSPPGSPGIAAHPTGIEAHPPGTASHPPGVMAHAPVIASHPPCIVAHSPIIAAHPPGTARHPPGVVAHPLTSVAGHPLTSQSICGWQSPVGTRSPSGQRVAAWS